MLRDIIRHRLGIPLLAAGAALTLAASGALAVERLVIAVDPPTVETNLFWRTFSDVTLFPAMGRLVGNDPVTGEYSNEGLAESWESNEDFTEWTFHLRQGVLFHDDWGELTAEDVAHSYELHAGEDSVRIGVERLRGAEVEVVDDHTVTFRFESPRVDFLFAVASHGSLVIYSKHQYEAEGIDGYLARPAGTEHFQFLERRIGEGILYERVDGHWLARMPHFRRSNSAGRPSLLPSSACCSPARPTSLTFRASCKATQSALGWRSFPSVVRMCS